MSIQEKREEAEAVLDSAEMILETYPGKGEKSRELETKVSQLEQELQDPDSEKSLQKLIDEIRDLMEEVEEEAMDEPMMDEPGGMGEEGFGPEDDMPPF